MSFKEQLLQDMKEAMKAKDVIRKNTIQLVRSGVLQVEKDKQVTLDDDGVLEVIAKELKKRRDSLPDFEKSGRQDLVDGLKREIEVLLSYLPAQLTDDELQLIVKEAVSEVGATTMRDIGKVMAVIMPKTTGRADGKRINEIVKEILG